MEGASLLVFCHFPSTLPVMPAMMIYSLSSPPPIWVLLATPNVVGTLKGTEGEEGAQLPLSNSPFGPLKVIWAQVPVRHTFLPSCLFACKLFRGHKCLYSSMLLFVITGVPSSVIGTSQTRHVSATKSLHSKY